MLIQKLLKLIVIFLGLFASVAQAEEEVYYPSSIKHLKKEIDGDKNDLLKTEHLKKICHQEYLNLNNQAANNKKPQEYVNGSEVSIFNNNSLTKLEKNLLQSNWSGSILFNNQELENIQATMDE